MPPTVNQTVRDATAGDAAAIARIYNHGIEDRSATFETQPRTAEQIETLLAERWAGGPVGKSEGKVKHPTIVVERAGQVVAWAGASTYRSRPCYDGVAEFSVYVDRSARGTGAGTAAMRGLIAACEALGFWKLTSRVFADNATSRAFHRSLGFREVGTYHRHGKLEGAWKDCVIVELLIGDALQ